MNLLPSEKGKVQKVWINLINLRNGIEIGVAANVGINCEVSWG